MRNNFGFIRLTWILSLALTVLGSGACNNSPYDEPPSNRKVQYAAMGSSVASLDPIKVGDTASNGIASNIHDTAYEYHYLKRPLVIKPAMATTMPRSGKTRIAGKEYPTFGFTIKKGLYYTDDKCFADGKGREVKIDDFIYTLKRNADAYQIPFALSILQPSVLGFNDFMKKISAARALDKKAAEGKNAKGETQANLMRVLQEPMQGLRKIDDYTIEIVLNRENPQLIYLFTLVNSSPSPPECVNYYNGLNGRKDYGRNPVGSGPYRLKLWHTQYRIILERNPTYRKDDFYPSEGNPGDEAKGLLKNKGKPLPLIDEYRFQMIQQTAPIWTLFEQGYLDRAGIPRDVYNQVMTGQNLSPEYVKKGIRLDKAVDVSVIGYVFNLKKAPFKGNKYLRQALSLAFDRREYIDRFRNGRGLVAHSPIPPNTEGYEADYKNPYSRFDLKEARRLLARAGYKDGVDPKTGKALKLELLMPSSPGLTSYYAFIIDQFSRLGVNIKVLQRDWPTVVKMKNTKEFQMAYWGWHMDYPDPQNVLQLLYGPNRKTDYNEGSYENPEFDALYQRMKYMPSGPERVAILRRMKEISAEDAPVIYTFFPLSYALSHKWVAPLLPHPINTNQLKFRDVDPELRARTIPEWNRPPLWAYILLGLILLLLGYIVVKLIQQKNKMVI